MAVVPFQVPHNIRQGAPAQAPQPDGIDVQLEGDSPAPVVTIDGSVVVPTEDGGVIVHLDGVPTDPADREFYDNLADDIPETELNKIADDLIRGIEADDSSRRDWVDTRAKGIELLGLKINGPRSGIEFGAPLEGMSTVQHPLLLEATLRFQANARGELLPSDGPVKVKNDGGGDQKGDQRASKLERAMNHYLTSVAKEYYPDTDRMLFYVGFGGCGFKKVYHCPLRNRPVSESVDANDMIVSNAATDITNAGRVTHKLMMRPATMRRMQLVGAYRDVELTQPQPEPNAVDRKQAQVQGTQDMPQYPEDMDHTIFECYCELDIPGYEHTDENDKASGLRIPYKVSIDKDSKKVLEIRRNYSEGDELCLAKQVFVKYSFVHGLGFYDIGLINILGNSTSALTAAWREMLDAGMFASFPGFLFAQDGPVRQKTNEFRVAPGQGVGLNTGGQPINQAVMPLPYQNPGATMIQLLDKIGEISQRVGGIAEIQTGEGRQDAPVGTTLALIEQAAKVLDAVHKRLHQAQSEEFQLLRDLFKEDPSALYRYKRTLPENDKWTSDQEIMNALDDLNLVPAADPNTPSSMHRALKAVALKQLQATNMQLYDPVAVDTYVMRLVGIPDGEQFFNKQPQAMPTPQADPNKMAELMLKAKQGDQKAQTDLMDLNVHMGLEIDKLREKALDRESRERVEHMHAEVEMLRLAFEAFIHPEGEPQAQGILNTVGYDGSIDQPPQPQSTLTAKGRPAP